MVVVSYKSKRELKKAIGKPLNQVGDLTSRFMALQDDGPFFVTNWDKTFKATITIVNGKIESVR